MELRGKAISNSLINRSSHGPNTKMRHFRSASVTSAATRIARARNVIIVSVSNPGYVSILSMLYARLKLLEDIIYIYRNGSTKNQYMYGMISNLIMKELGTIYIRELVYRLSDSLRLE